VTSDVLPSIRKTGGYLTPTKTEELLTNPDLLIDLATALKKERQLAADLQEKVEVQQKLIAPLQKKANFVDRILDTGEKIDIGQAAKILGLPFGRNTLFRRLREKGIFFVNRNEPKQQYIDRGYFLLKEQWIDKNEHDGFMIVKVLVTQKGLSFLSGEFDAASVNCKLATIG
jgi:phage antirepressor YoqD-like protein